MKCATCGTFKKGFRTQAGGGTYHNKKFKEAAEAHGLTVEKTVKNGWSKTTLTPETEAFVKAMEKQGFSLVRPKVGGLKGAAKKQSSRKYVCPCCGAIIRATKEVYVICGDCEVPFEESEV